MLLRCSSILLPAVLIGCAAPPAGERAPDTGIVDVDTSPDFADIAYATEHERQKLDIYLPDGVAGPVPLVIYFHGGGWNWGERTRIEPWVGAIIARGFAAASVDYRWSSEAVFPAQIHDCKGAVRWLRANASAYGIDPDRFAVIGASSGAHLASLLATSGDVAQIEGTVGGNIGISSRAQACAHFYGATDLIELRVFRGEDASESTLMGFSVGDVVEHVDDPAYADRLALVESADPVRYVTPDDPPFYIVHGEDDTLVPWTSSRLLADALDASLVPNTFVLLPDVGHEAPLEQLELALDLFQQVLE